MKGHESEGKSTLISVKRWDGNNGWGRTTVGERRAMAAIGLVWFVVVIGYSIYLAVTG